MLASPRLAIQPTAANYCTAVTALPAPLQDQFAAFVAERHGKRLRREHRTGLAVLIGMVLDRPWRAVLLPENDARLQRGSDVNPWRVGRRTIGYAAEFLAERRLATVCRGYRSAQHGLARWIQATPLLRAIFDGFAILEDRPLVEVRNGRVGERDRAIAAAPVAVLNECWRHHRCTLDGELIPIAYHRVFRDDLTKLGRFYCGAIQNKSRTERARILIDGESTVEFDYRASQVAIVYSLAGLPLQRDPYQIDGLPRDTAKAMILRLLFCRTVSGWKRTVTQSASRERKRDAQRWPAWAEDIGFIPGVPTGMTGDVAFALIAEAHPALARFAGTPDLSLRLQNIEAAVMAAVVAMIPEVPVLAIHDGIRCRARDAENVATALASAAERLVGWDVPVEPIGAIQAAA